MPVEVTRDLCIGDAICVDECPVECIYMDDEQIAVIEQDECIDCGACIDPCPTDAIDWV